MYSSFMYLQASTNDFIFVYPYCTSVPQHHSGKNKNKNKNIYVG